MSRKNGGSGHVSIEDNVDSSIQSLEDYIKKREGRRICANRNNTDNTKLSVKKSWDKNNCRDISSDKHVNEMSHEKIWCLSNPSNKF